VKGEYICTDGTGVILCMVMDVAQIVATMMDIVGSG